MLVNFDPQRVSAHFFQVQSRLDVVSPSRHWTCCTFVEKPLGSLVSILVALSPPIQLVVPHMVCLMTLDIVEAKLEWR